MAAERHPLLDALKQPERCGVFDLAAWNRLVRQAKACGLLAKLAARFEAAGHLDQVPEKVQNLMRDARIGAARNQVEIRFEVNRVLRAIAGLDLPVILLKGAAYIAADLPCARGRVASDIDILVPAADLDAVEQALLDHGWVTGKQDDYDQAYYRRWMHELPPLVHPERQTIIDLHHTILPVTSRLRPDSRALFEAAVATADPRVKVLAPADMVIHGALHLFYDGAFEMGLRNLVDLEELLRTFGGDEGRWDMAFWDLLRRRAELHDARLPLFYLLRQGEALLDLRVPRPFAAAVADWGPRRPLRGVIDALMRSALTPRTPWDRTPWDRTPWDRAPWDRPPAAGLADWLLFCRSHWLRMPPGLLARHLAVKAFRRAKSA